eukprot:TRINITY_DN1059_c0_g1_i2.p1 TRINITY_DN1059_c0_g1~~TRINITY_DN1059_c0_g1_i2.p1  ORF type:complete len:199 (-),score=38.88 TRINITY_DN1059_c0_g1_i2:264-860(-)
MSANLGKCAKCAKTVYQLEGVTAAKKAWHKGCFKCEICGWQLNYQNYKDLDGKVYCANHYPITGFGDHRAHGTIDTSAVSVASASSAPKLDTVNDQVRGDGPSKSIGLDSMAMRMASSAPKLDTVNDQVRGEGGKGIGMDSMAMAMATAAPKLDVVNDQVRGEGKGVGMDSVSMAIASSAPKLDVATGIDKSSFAKQT